MSPYIHSAFYWRRIHHRRRVQQYILTAFIGRNAKIGHHTLIHPNVTIREKCIVGNNVIINSGAIIGSDGFGFAPDGAKKFKIPQLGIVQIDDDVEIGACTTIDRATIGKTWIKRGAKLDNLIQIAHNCTIGEDSIIIAHTGHIRQHPYRRPGYHGRPVSYGRTCQDWKRCNRWSQRRLLP